MRIFIPLIERFTQPSPPGRRSDQGRAGRLVGVRGNGPNACRRGYRFIQTAIAGIALALPLKADEPTAKELPPCCQKELAPGKPLTDGSLYQLESKWTSDVGREIRLGVLRGKPQVVVLFFAKCEFACPILLHDMKRLEAALSEQVRDEVGFVLVTFDSENDTVAALHAYREKQQLSPKRWTLLRGEPDDVRELAALLGINYQRDARGQFAHSNLITLLNREGEIVHQVNGLNTSVEEPAKILTRLTQE